jgi:hypothetical protein
MSDSNRNGVFVTWLAFGCLILAVAGYALWGDLRNAEPAVADQYEASRYADRAQGRIDRICVGLAGVELLHCEYEVEQPERENYRAQKDLRAQWYMAIWAGFMTLFTFGTLIVTGLGVHFVRQTLYQTAKTNDAAVGAAVAANRTNEIMRDEGRPWVTTTRDVGCEFVNHGGHTGAITWNYNFVNKGKTPAYSVEINVRMFKGTDGFECLRHIDAFTDKSVSDRGSSNLAILFPGEETEYFPFTSYQSAPFDMRRNEDGNWEKAIPIGDKFSLLVCITYKTGLDDSAPIGVETSAYGIAENRKGFIGPWRHEILEWNPARKVR